MRKTDSPTASSVNHIEDVLPPIPLAIAEITDDDEREVVTALRSGWLTHGPYNERFEHAFADYIGVGNAISLNSCTSALQLSLMGLGVTGEVILPSFTFVASANAIVNAGATPVFADIEAATRTLAPSAVAAAVTPRTEAIMAVHYAGHPCDMTEIEGIAQRHGLAVIEDSAEAIGATYDGRRTGGFGVGCFSFYPTKNMTTGEGGMLTTNDDGLAATVRTLMAHGISSSTLARERVECPWLRAATMAGHNFRMSNVLAALGTSQIRRLDDMNRRRREHAEWYTGDLKELEGLELPIEGAKSQHSWQMYTVRLRERDRTGFLAALRESGVGASVHFDPPVHLQPYYQATIKRQPDLRVTEQVASSIVTLPLWPSMTTTQRARVATSVRTAL